MTTIQNADIYCATRDKDKNTGGRTHVTRAHALTGSLLMRNKIAVQGAESHHTKMRGCPDLPAFV